MIFYIARRILSAISVIIVTLIASFALFYMAPSDPAGLICGAKCNPARIAAISHSLRLDEPKPKQLLEYMEGLVVGQDITSSGVTVHCDAPCLGYSYQLGVPVTTIISNALPVTVSIVAGGAVVFLVIGVWTGIVAAKRRGTTIDRAIVMFTQGFSSLPYFVFALVVALYVPSMLKFMPESQYTSIFDNPIKWASGLLLVWLAYGFFNSALYTRYARASMIESLSEDYVRTARSKGISERKVVYTHALRAALTPIATIFGLDVAFQLGGAVFTESIFNLPGLGVITLRAFSRYDLPVLMASVLIGATVLVVANLIVDILYTILDPRVRLS